MQSQATNSLPQQYSRNVYLGLVLKAINLYWYKYLPFPPGSLTL